MQRKSSLSQFKLAKNVANNCFSTVHSVLSEIPLELVIRLMSVDGSTISKQPGRSEKRRPAATFGNYDKARGRLVVGMPC